MITTTRRLPHNFAETLVRLRRITGKHCLQPFRMVHAAVPIRIRNMPQVIGDTMIYSGPIDLDALVDLDALAAEGACHWTFLAFPTSTVNEHGIPTDLDAQRYIAAVQSAGVPVGIWRNTPVDGTAYAAVTHVTIPQLFNAIETLTQFHDSFAADLSERLFRDSSASGT